jgi:myo-inositol-1(or 4)-monophosphatase
MIYGARQYMIEDLQILREVVRLAGQQELLPRFTRIGFDYKQDGSVLTEADLAVQGRLQQALRERWPDIALLGEEMPVAEQQAIIDSGAAYWCLDPLDGTSNFAAGIPFYSISLALIRDRRPQLAIVYDPARNECFSAAAGRGAWLDERRLDTAALPQRPLAHCSALLDFKRLVPDLASRIAQQPPYASQRSFGSVALDWCWIATGRCQVYLHGRQNLWDYAAGWLVLHEAGGHSCTLDGAEGFNATLTPCSAVAASTPELYSQWYAWLRT